MGIAPTPVWGQEPTEQPQQSVWQTVTSDITLLLYVGAVFFELLIGILTYYGVVPGALRWAGDLLVLTMIGLTFARMLLSDYLPKVVIFLLACDHSHFGGGELYRAGSGCHTLGDLVFVKYRNYWVVRVLVGCWPPEFARSVLPFLFQH